jgi:hypothetical protein
MVDQPRRRLILIVRPEQRSLEFDFDAEKTCGSAWLKMANQPRARG